MAQLLKKLIIVFAFVALVIISIAFIMQNVAKKPSNTAITPAQFNKFWGDEIKNKGALSAYKEFKNTNKKSQGVSRHINAHRIGELLYKFENTDAINICDISFNYGCMHGLFISATEKEGIGALNNLYDKCPKDSIPAEVVCQHSLGHGLLEYFGATDAGVKKAVARCYELKENNSLFGCASAVMMGYEFPYTQGDYDGVVKVMPAVKDPYALCQRFEAEYQDACYFSMPAWWIGAYKIDYPQVSEKCRDVSDPRQKDNCFTGTGRIISLLEDFNVNSVIEKCGLIEDSFVEKCLDGAAQSFSILRSNNTQAKDQICKLLSDQYNYSCSNESQTKQKLKS